MFNIKKKIYVAHENELVDLMYHRCVILHKDYPSLTGTDDMSDDKSARGVLAAFNNYAHMMKAKFNDDPRKFHDFLNQEENLLIVANKNDYAQIYSECQLELKFDFGVTEANLAVMRNQQRLKDFFLGDLEMRKFCYAQNPKDSSFDRVFKKVKEDYKPTGNLFRQLPQLPVEVIYAMYKWGNISKNQANTKFSDLARGLLISEIEIILESGKHAIANSPEILQKFLGKKTIKSVDGIIKAIFADPFLTKIFCNEETDIDLDDADEVAKIKKLCAIIIEKYIEFELQPEVDQQELDFFFELYETKDVDVIEKAKVNLINTGMVATRQGKFNTGLIMAV